MNMNGNLSFAEHARQRALEIQAESNQLLQEQRRIALRLDKCTEYLDQLNTFLEAEGLQPVKQKDVSQQKGFARPGNRAKDMPVRKAEWDGMNLSQVVDAILADTDDSVHADTICQRTYEIQNKADMKRAKRSIVSTLRAGVRNGRWDGLGGNNYKRKMKEAVPVQ